MQAHYRCDGEVYCSACAPSECEPDFDSNETDVPENCSVCGRRTEYCLTGAGVRCVLNYIRESLADRGGWDERIDSDAPGLTWYVGSRHVEIVRDWAADLQWYSLTPEDSATVSEFLAASAPCFPRSSDRGRIETSNVPLAE